MPIAPSLKELKSMSEEELVSLYDQLATNTQVGTNYYLDEIRHRQSQRLATKMAKLTWIVTLLTVVITVATIINVAIFVNDSPSFPAFLN